MYSYIIAGVGGQGTVLSSRILAEIFMNRAYNVRTTETIGMAQRGGSVTSHLRASKKEIFSPILPEGSADAVFGYELSEVIRNAKYIGENTVILASKTIIKPVTDTLSKEDYRLENVLEDLYKLPGKKYVFDFSDITEAIKTDKVMNIAMIGAAIGIGVLECTKDDALKVMESILPGKILEVNKLALELGYELGDRA